MEIDKYQELTTNTAVYRTTSAITPDTAQLAYVVMGLVGEAGEVANKVKKIIRDKNGEINEETKRELIDELGDVFWYLAQCAEKIDVDLSVIAMTNLKKLEERKKKNTLQGSGDGR